jgi:hypothetical protein
MKFVATFVVVLVASASALNSAQYTFANTKLTSFENALSSQVSNTTNSIVSALNNEFSYLQKLKTNVLNSVNALGNTQVTADVTNLINSIGAEIVAKFNPQAIASSILAPYLAKFANWYAQVSAEVTALNTTTPPVSLACLKSVQGSINGNITDLTSRVTSTFNQQLSTIKARFSALNTAINTDISKIDANIAKSCGNSSPCAAGVIEASLKAVNAKANAYIQ